MEPHNNPQPHPWLNLPNCLTFVRIICSPLTIPLAWSGATPWLLALVMVLVLTEWLDGLLARLLHQESPLGARLDTVADAVFYGSLIPTVALLDRNLVAHEIVWISLAIATYALSWASSWGKFHRLPSYHTWAAKVAWGFIGAGIVVHWLGWSDWPFRVAMIVVMLVNLEAVCITWLLPEVAVDIPTAWHAWRKQRALQRD